MKKDKVVFFIIIFSLLSCVYVFLLNIYAYRISIKINGLDSEMINATIADDISDELNQIKEIRESYIFSKDGICNIYCKIPKIFKNKIDNKLQSVIFPIIKNFPYPLEVQIDDSFDKPYDIFLVLSGESLDYKLLKKYSSNIFKKILSLKSVSKIINFGVQNRALYLYYDDFDLKKYNVTLSDICMILKKNNVFPLTNLYFGQNENYLIDVKSYFSSFGDVEKIALNQKNPDFISKFSDIFEIKDEIITPLDYFIDFNNKKAQIIAINSKNIFHKFYLKYKIKKILNDSKGMYFNLDFDILDTSKLNSLILPFNSSFGVESLKNQKKIIFDYVKDDIKNILFFGGVDSLKISHKFSFFENNKNKIVILVNKNKISKLKNILKKNNVLYLENKFNKKFEYDLNKINLNNYDNFSDFTYKIPKIKYFFNEEALGNYQISKKDVVDTIESKTNGYYCCNFFNEDGDNIPIILRSKTKNVNFIYSKKYQDFLNLDLFVKTDFQNDFYSILRKNSIYYQKIYK